MQTNKLMEIKTDHLEGPSELTLIETMQKHLGWIVNDIMMMMMLRDVVPRI